MSRTGLKLKLLACIVIFGFFICWPTGTASAENSLPFPFVDDMESGTANWLVTPVDTWTITSPVNGAHSPTNAWIFSDYTKNTDAALTLADNVNIPVDTNPYIEFWHMIGISGEDQALVEYSTDNGITWQVLAAYKNRHSANWQKESINLYGINGNVCIRFRMVTDGSVTGGSWTIDDVSIFNSAISPPEPGMIVSYPYFDDAEAGSGCWQASAPWGITDEYSHNGQYSWTDSPYAAYNNSINTVLTLKVDLSPAQKPMLSFWQKCSMINEDYGCVEVSKDNGATWTALYLVTETRDDWQEVRIDLTEYIGPNFALRFRFTSNSSLTSDGWYIDDININETQQLTHNLPFVDNVNTEQSNNYWLSSSWARTIESSDNYTWSTYNAKQGKYYLTSPIIDLTNATNPQLAFSSLLPSTGSGYQYVGISTNEGRTWGRSITISVSADWRQYQIDLTPYMGQKIRVRFVNELYYWGIDNISINESGSEVLLNPITNATRHTLDLSWSAYEKPEFERYEIRRAKNPGVNTGSTLIAVITDPQQTSYTDTNLEMGLDYYYKIYVVKPTGVYGTGSNEVAGKTDYIRTYPFSDDLEDEASTIENWDLHSWGRTNDSAHSGLYSLADSPGSDYSVNQVKSLTTAIDLSSAQIPQLRFWQKYSLGNGDYATIEVSTDLDRTWKCIYYTSGVQLNWHQIKVDLSQYRGNANVRLRFKLTSDGSDIGGGWNIDDVTIAETLTPLIDFPASDGAEDADTQIDWSPSCWYKSPEAAHSGQYGWQTSPYVSGQYCLTSPPINLGNANHPQLVFWSHDSYNYSGRYVEIKSNQDSTWTRVLSLPNPNTGVWNRYQLDLSQYKGMEISVRFVTGNGLWKIDDIGISESGNDVVLNPVSNPTRHSLDLTWNAYEGADFIRYEIRRTKTPGVTITSPLIASISDPQQTSYIDNNLEMGLEYYYKIFVVELGEVYSAGSNEISAKTDYIRTYPFYDDMEDELTTSNNWDLYTWGRTSKVSHGGSYSLADSPGSDYGNNQIRSLTTTVDLSTSRIPQLRYWQRYSLGSGDCISIEVSTDLERSWTCIYSSSGAQLNWEQVTLDLTPYGGKSCVRLRFKLTSDNTDIADGWEIDDVTIGEISSPVISLPASDGAEDTDTQINWSSSNWYRSTEAAHTGQYGWKNDSSIRGNYYLTSSLISLRNTDNPQLVFWSQDYYRNYGYQFVEISTNLGRTWERLVNMANSSNTVWNRYQVDLTPYKGMEVILRFVNYAYTYNVDDIKIVERPVDVSLQLPSGITRTQMDLNWTQSKDPNFIRYEIRRSNQANVTVNSEHVASITDPTQLTCTDTNLTMGLLYYYKVFVVATGDVYSLGSNEVFANTANVKQYPFYDNFSNNSGNWNFNKWGIIADTDENQYAYSDGYCLTNLPKPYQPNQEMTATTVLDLSMAKMPVLEFWHKYTLGNGDHGWVEVSLDSSSTWKQLYHITTSSIEYTKAEIDLSAFAGRSRVMLRFRLNSDGSDNADGWYVDNVSVADTGVPLIALPLTENAERAESEVYWFNADWFKSGSAAHTGARGWDGWNIYGALTTANNIDLKHANNPQLIFWSRNQSYCGNNGVDISTNNGITWNRIYTMPGSSTDTNWSRYQIDLSPYKGQEIRMRFSRTGSYDRWWHLDDISISDKDIILPGATNDLRIDSVLPRSISLKWSAAGDDGYSGRAYQYDVRYATVEITPENWDTATPVAIVPLPGLPSTRETLTVNGLEPNTKYYFALKTSDEAQNWSSLSNVASATTPAEIIAGATIVSLKGPAEVLTTDTAGFQLTAKVNQVSNLSVANYTIAYNPALFEFVSASAGNIGGVSVPLAEGDWHDDGNGHLTVVQSLPDNTTASGSGNLAGFLFKVKATGLGTFAFTNGTLSDEEAYQLLSQWFGQEVRSLSLLSGDANASGSVNSTDIVKVKRIILGLDSSTEGADANHDGNINALDIATIKRIILGL